MLGLRPPALLLGLLTLAVACGPSIDPTADGGADGSGGSSGSAEDTAPTADSTGGGGSMGSLGMGHGMAPIQFFRAPNATDDPFVGTAHVELRFQYDPCLVDFYESQPSWRQDGPDGGLVLDLAFAQGLCTNSDPDLAECTVTEIQQELDTAQTLTIRYDVTGPLEQHHLYFGPLPTSDLAACPDDALPTVSVLYPDGAQGFDAATTQLWNIDGYDPYLTAADIEATLDIRGKRL